MIEILTEAAKQVPALVVLVTFVLLVLKHLKEKDSASREGHVKRDEQFLKAIEQRDSRFLVEMNNLQERADKRAEKNTEVVERNSQVMARVTVVLDRVEARLERIEDDETRRKAIEDHNASSSNLRSTGS